MRVLPTNFPVLAALRLGGAHLTKAAVVAVTILGLAQSSEAGPVTYAACVAACAAVGGASCALVCLPAWLMADPEGCQKK